MTLTNYQNLTAVLVHAAWSDASSWNKVTAPLRDLGLRVRAAQIPLTSLSEDVAAVLGTPNNPMSRDQVVAKSRDLMMPVLGASASAKLIEKALSLEYVKTLRELRPLLQRA